MKTFSIQTLGCKVNHYESEQIAQFLRSRGLKQSDPALADLRVIHTCSVTTAAASQSRQAVRRLVRLPLLVAPTAAPSDPAPPGDAQTQGAKHKEATGAADRTDANCSLACGGSLTAVLSNPVLEETPSTGNWARISARPRVVVSGCWATSDRDAARAIPGVDAVLTHHDDIALQLQRLLTEWETEGQAPHSALRLSTNCERLPGPETLNEKDIGWIKQAGTSASQLTGDIKTSGRLQVNRNFVESSLLRKTGANNLPLLGERQTGRQRAFLKIQDGCDAHCTYCIIPSLRPKLWSKPIEEAVEEARALVAAGHVEIILTGIFLGAYGQPTALRRRQPALHQQPVRRLIELLCRQVPGLQRLRLSSLEPGDLTDDLISTLRACRQVVPHFHLPLQSGSDLILRRMNRQYSRDDYLEMVDRLHSAFDRPALTTDIVVGFPGEDDAEFEQTADVVARSGFIHVHAFPYSPRPGTAAARWTDQFVHGPVVNERIGCLTAMAAEHGLRFRRSFVGEVVEVIVERDNARSRESHHHGRCERYFDVRFEDPTARAGDRRSVRIERATMADTWGQSLSAR